VNCAPNEIVLLAYYIAAINIEAAYHGVRGGQYEPFGGIVLTDTFRITEPGDTMDAEIFPQNNDRILWLVKQQRHFVHLRCTSTLVVASSHWRIVTSSVDVRR
jgi:predicted helicase